MKAFTKRQQQWAWFIGLWCFFFGKSLSAARSATVSGRNAP
jgi:hypothetical protein